MYLINFKCLSKSSSHSSIMSDLPMFWECWIHPSFGVTIKFVQGKVISHIQFLRLVGRKWELLCNYQKQNGSSALYPVSSGLQLFHFIILPFHPSPLRWLQGAVAYIKGAEPPYNILWHTLFFDPSAHHIWRPPQSLIYNDGVKR